MEIKKIYLFGFSRWKHGFIKPFFKKYQTKIFFINPIYSKEIDLALKKGLCEKSEIFIWGKKEFSEVEEFAKRNGINIIRVEDGFIRSVGLGSNLTPTYSLIFDQRGIYFDPTQESDLEKILNTYDFKNDKELLRRAAELKETIINNKISKYNSDKEKNLSFSTEKTISLVIGQVENDASIKYGANGMSNLELLKSVKERFPNNYIIYKPHPDVLSGNRVGGIDKSLSLNYCDEIIVDVSMSSVLEVVDEVHTMTSLTGFEGLLYGKKVYTYGMPFYAGWGLTTDSIENSKRSRKISLDELVAATLILYPQYIDPFTKKRSSVEEVVKNLKVQKDLFNDSFFYSTKFTIENYIVKLYNKILSLF